MIKLGIGFVLKILFAIMIIMAIGRVIVAGEVTTPPSLIIIDGVILVGNKSWVVDVSWGSLSKRIEVPPNISRIVIEFNVLNIRSNIRISIENALNIILIPHPTHGYRVQSIHWKSDELVFNSIIIKEVTTIIQLMFKVYPPPTNISSILVGGEEVEYNLSSSMIAIAKPIFVDPHKPLDIELSWRSERSSGRYAAKMLLYHDEVKIDGVVNGTIATFKVVAVPSLQIVEYQFSLNPSSNALSLLKELKKVVVSYEVASLGNTTETLEEGGFRLIEPIPSNISSTPSSTPIPSQIAVPPTSINSIQKLSQILRDNVGIILLYLSLVMIVSLIIYTLSASIKSLIIVILVGIVALIIALMVNIHWVDT